MIPFIQCPARIKPWYSNARLHAWIAAVVWLTVLHTGCGDRSQKFIPNSQEAERALETALDAWKAGHPAGAITGTSPLVHVTDASRKAKQTLQDYRILGEVHSHHGRRYVVELELTDPAEKVKAEYIIVGIDPLWVFRREDYELLMHWDHHMPETSTASTPAPTEN